MDKDKEQSLAAACMDYFGKLPGTGLADFQKEYKALTDADKEEIKAGLEREGYKIRA